MSIIMRTLANTASKDLSDQIALDPVVVRLLDHLAVELAEEYIRLMEAAAAAESASPPSR